MTARQKQYAKMAEAINAKAGKAVEAVEAVEAVDLTELTKKQLKEILTAYGVDFNKKDTNESLITAILEYEAKQED